MVLNYLLKNYNRITNYAFKDIYFSYRFSECLVDSSAIAICLLYLNCDKEKLRLERYLPELEYFQSENNISNLKENQKTSNWRNMFTVVTQLKILKKLIHRHPNRQRLLVKSKGPQICKQVITNIPHELVRLYALKIFKEILKYLNQRWRNSM